MNERDMHIFLEVGVNFFEKTTGEKATFGTGTLQFGKSELLDYSGVIRVSGASEGLVCLTVSRAMIDEMLRATGEIPAADALACDLVGEVASIIASNARKFFGPRFGIAPPETFASDGAAHLALPFARFALPIHWRGFRAHLILALGESAAALELDRPSLA